MSMMMATAQKYKIIHVARSHEALIENSPVVLEIQRACSHCWILRRMKCSSVAISSIMLIMVEVGRPLPSVCWYLEPADCQTSRDLGGGLLQTKWMWEQYSHGFHCINSRQTKRSYTWFWSVSKEHLKFGCSKLFERIQPEFRLNWKTLWRQTKQLRYRIANKVPAKFRVTPPCRCSRLPDNHVTMMRRTWPWPEDLSPQLRMEEVGASLERVAGVANMMGECHSAKNSSCADNCSSNKVTWVTILFRHPVLVIN